MKRLVFISLMFVIVHNGVAQGIYGPDSIFLQKKFITDNNLRTIKISVKEFVSPRSEKSNKSLAAKWDSISILFQKSSDFDTISNALLKSKFFYKSFDLKIQYDSLGNIIMDSLYGGNIYADVIFLLKKMKPKNFLFTKQIEGGVTINVKIKGEQNPTRGVGWVYCDSIVEYNLNGKIIKEEHYCCSPVCRGRTAPTWYTTYSYDNFGNLLNKRCFTKSRIDDYEYKYSYKNNKIIEERYCSGYKLRACKKIFLYKYDTSGKVTSKILNTCDSRGGDLCNPAIMIYSYEYISYPR